MLRYVVAAVAALVLLAVALYPRGGGGTPTTLAVPEGPPPVVSVAKGPEGRVVTVSHAFRGSVTRASLVYELEGADRTAAVETDCRRGRAASVTDDGYATVLELTGTLPDGASHVRLVVESETGTDTYPIEP
jgi:hypothetical protein